MRERSSALPFFFCAWLRPRKTPPGHPGGVVLWPGEEDQAVSVSVEEKNIAWLTAERTCSSV